MNARIKLLAEQAGYTKGHYDEYGRLTVMPEFNKEKFAELIVRECASLAYDGPGGILDHFRLEEHFGVEE